MFFVSKNIELIYGGASVGLMGIIADTVLNNHGKVHGIIPKVLVNMEVAHQNLTKLTLTSNMHERKQKMYDLSDF